MPLFFCQLTKTLIPTSGTVLLDGIDMAVLSSKSVREAKKQI